MHRLRHASHRRALAWLLACVLVLAQGLGLAHSVLHGAGNHAEPALFGQHAGSDCLLYDQLSHGDALAMALPQQPPAVAVALPAATPRAGVTPAFAAAYAARAPPRG